MPTQLRHICKRKLAQALNLLDKSEEYVRFVDDAFSEQHPELVPMLHLIELNIELTQRWIFEFWKIAWGYVPRNYHTWRL